MNVQVPLVHAIVAFARGGHSTPHIPQFDRLLAVFTSQPSPVIALQSRNEPSHAYEQDPLLHVVVVFGRDSHAVPHAPQWVRLACVSTSQPSTAEPLQFSYGGVQVNPQDPEPHVRTEFAGVGQLFMHIPQCERLVPVLISQPSPGRPLQSPNIELHV